MNTKLTVILIFSMFLAGCGHQKPSADKAHAPVQQAAAINKNVPASLTTGMVFSKKISTRSKNYKVTQQAGDFLQIALALRDAARGKPHKIAPLANGSVLQIDLVNTQYTLKTTSLFDQATRLESVFSGKKNGVDHQISITSSNTIPEALPQETTLTITPESASECFTQEFIEAAHDTIEAGYASNEISLTLSDGTKTTSLCRRGSTSRMYITLEPQKIEFSLDGYGLAAHTFLSVVLGLPSAAPTISPSKEKAVSKKLLFVLMPQDFQDIEFSNPYNALAKAGYDITIAGLSSGICIGTEGTTVKPDRLLSTMTPQNFDQYAAIIIPGGKASPTFLWQNEELHTVVRYFHEQKKLVATICWACVVPARAGILKNLKATVYPTDDAQQIFLDNQVLFDDVLCVALEKEQIITAQSPRAVDLFTQNILQQLQSPVKENPHG